MKDDEFEGEVQAQKATKGNVTAPFGRHAEQIRDRTRNQSFSVPVHNIFRSQTLVRYSPGFPCAKANDRQKIELSVEILEGHLGGMKSTHSMNAATWWR